MIYLVDTNIISELLRPRPNTGVLQWMATQTKLGFSVISVDESIYGLTLKNNRLLLEAFERTLIERCTIYPITENIARQAGTLRGEFQRGCHTIPTRHAHRGHRPTARVYPRHPQYP